MSAFLQRARKDIGLALPLEICQAFVMGDIENRAKRRMMEMGIKPSEDPSLWDSIWFELANPGPLGTGRAAQPPLPPAEEPSRVYPPGKAPIPEGDFNSRFIKGFRGK